MARQALSLPLRKVHHGHFPNKLSPWSNLEVTYSYPSVIASSEPELLVGKGTDAEIELHYFVLEGVPHRTLGPTSPL